MESKTEAPPAVQAVVPPAYQPADGVQKPPQAGEHNVMQMQPLQGNIAGVPLASLGAFPAMVECPNCHNRGFTAVENQSGGFTHAVAGLVCLVSCLGCIPYLITSLKDAHHKCTKCGIPLATYHRSGRVEVLVQG